MWATGRLPWSGKSCTAARVSAFPTRAKRDQVGAALKKGKSKTKRRSRRLKAPLWVTALLAVALTGWFVTQPEGRRQEVARLLGNTLAREKRISLFDVAWDLHQLYYANDYVAAKAAGDKTHVYGGLPAATTFPHSVRVLANQGFVTGYCDALGNPVWTAYRIRDLSPLPKAPERPGTFTVDARTLSRVAPEDYTNSGYDRGHMAPNYAIATRYGAAAQRETFLMSNIAPQRRELNAGVWRELEMKAATSYPGRFGEVWVIAGPVFDQNPRELDRGIMIPAAFYMIVIDEHEGGVRAQAILVPQEAGSDADLRQLRTSIDEIEQRTGLDFLNELDEAAEELLEAPRAGRVW